VKNSLGLAGCLALIALVAGVAAGGAGASVTRTDATALVSPPSHECAAPNLLDIADSDAFWYWPCASFLHVAVSPAGESKGFVRSDPYYIDCPWACTRPFEDGSQTTLYAFPSNGVTFAGWNGDACAGQANPCTLTVSGDVTVTADFTGDIVPPDSSTVSTRIDTVIVFMGFEPAATVTGTNGYVCAGFGCAPAQYPDGTVVTLTSGVACNTFTDSTSPGTKPNPYTFTVNTASRVVAPHVGCA
jgi:uncharacterized repeat protein (TIGR02543 family)